ncbi:MAG: hypothetical protein K1X52_11910 [Pyrinomonadaceae bacterium]|nr:hypothetical protein [Pyrinomonadaceae bacterium]
MRDANGVVIAKYSYDGEGKRVKKEVTATGETTVFVYSSGKLVAEYSTAPPPASPQVSYTTTDHLGSPRVITNALGQVTSRRDFLPFGEEITQNVGSRTASLGYGTSDTIRQKFTGYQKDEETSLDFAEARMYSNPFGRFTAVDPLLASGRTSNPQTFNRYIYVGNSPLTVTDPSGLDWYRRKSSQEGREWDYKWFSGEADKGWDAVDFGSSLFYQVDNGLDVDNNPLGTIFLHRYEANYSTVAQHAMAIRQNAKFQPGGACFSNFRCAGIRDPINDATNHFAAQEGVEGFPIGFVNAAKSSVDIPTWNLLPSVPNSSLNSLFGVNTWFNYQQPQGQYQIAGASGGALTFDILALIATKKVGGAAADFLGRGGTFGERLFMSKNFGRESRLFGNSAFNATGRPGILNRKGTIFKVGWSGTPSNGGGMQFRIGFGVNAQKANIASRHLYVPRTFVPNSFSNPLVVRH